MDDKPDLVPIMALAGVELGTSRERAQIMARCPFHDDGGRPNMSVSPNSGLWHCFRCGRGGDVYDFQGQLVYGDAWNHRDEEMFKDVLVRLGRLDVPRVRPQPAAPPRELTREIVQVLALASRVYHLALLGKAGEAARGYLAGRAIDGDAISRFRLGYAVPGALLGALAGYPPQLRRAAEVAGLYLPIEKGARRELMADRVVFPDLDRHGRVLHMVGRSLLKDAGLRYLSLNGLPKTLWGLANVRPGEPVILTESIIDVVNLRQMGYQGVAVNGTGIAGHLLPRLRRRTQLFILSQNDEAGLEAAQRWLDKLPKARLLEHSFDSGEKDLNDQVVHRGLRAARDLVTTSLARASERLPRR